MKGPFSKKEMEFFQSFIYAGLKQLRDIGKGANYECFCQYTIDSLPSNIISPEWVSYWNHWKKKFGQYTSKVRRNIIFRECIIDLKNKGLLPSDTSGLTARFSQKIEKIIQEKTPSN